MFVLESCLHLAMEIQLRTPIRVVSTFSGGKKMPCNVCKNVLEKGESVEIIWSELTHFVSLFDLRWPQRTNSAEAFDRQTKHALIWLAKTKRYYLEFPPHGVVIGITTSDLELCQTELRLKCPNTRGCYT